MKIMQQTSTHLTLKKMPYLGWLLGGIFILAGVGGGVLLGSKTSLECDRTPPSQCQLSHRYAWGDRTQQFAIESLREAVVDERRDSDGDRTYQVVLELQNESLDLTPYSSSGAQRHRNYAEQINRFLANPSQTTLEINDDARIWGLLLVIPFASVGSLLLLLSPQVICDIDKYRGTLILQRRGLLGRADRTVAIRDIVGVQLQRSASGRNSSRIALLLKSGEAVPFSRAYTNGVTDGVADKRQVVELLQTFLGTASEVPTEIAYEMPTQVMQGLMALIGNPSRRKEVIAESEARVRQNPDDVEAYCTLGVVLSMEGDRKKAREILEKGRSHLMRQGKVAEAQQLDQLLESMRLNT